MWDTFIQNGNPRKSGFYWLTNRFGQKILAHFSTSGEWHGMDAHGQSFKITDPYTHYTPVLEPSGVTAK